MTQQTAETFEPTDESRAIFNKLFTDVMTEAQEKFFALWELENDPLKAGSIVAASYMRTAARIAIFGSMCGHHNPREEQWMELALENFEHAIIDVAAAFTEIEKSETGDNR